MSRIIKFLFAIPALLLAVCAQAQSNAEMADTMRSEGKIYVVVGIILIVLTGLILYIFLVDRKVKKLEDQLSDKKR